MKPLEKSKVVKLDAIPVGKAEIVVMPPSSTKAASKGGWQAAWVWVSGVIAFLVALWTDPAFAAIAMQFVKDHPEWMVGFTVLNFAFPYLKNVISHRHAESRLAIVGEPKQE